MKRFARRSGLSLIEMLIVIGLLGLLLGIVLSAVQMARDSADRTSCENNLHQIGVALQAYHDAHGRIPPGSVNPENLRDPATRLSWMAFILPQIDRNELYEASLGACEADPVPIHNPPHTGFATVVDTYVCPADGRLYSPLTDSFGVSAAYSSYVGIRGAVSPNFPRALRGVFGTSPGIRLAEVTDGQSNTIMVGERTPPGSLQAGWWYPKAGNRVEGGSGPDSVLFLGVAHQAVLDRDCQGTNTTFGPGRLDNPCDRYHLWALHSGGANFLFADGSVRFFGYSAEPLMIPLATISGGEVIDWE